MTVYERGSIVLVNFNPQKRAEEIGKTRPAVIVSDSELNEVLDLVAVVPLTTNLIDGAEPLRIRLKPREALKQESDAMIEQLRSVAKNRIGECVGKVTPLEIEKIEEGLKAMLGVCR